MDSALENRGAAEARLRQRVLAAMDQILARSTTVSLLDVLVAAGFVHGSHVDQWRRGHPAYEHILEHVNCGAAKWRQVMAIFLEAAAARGLPPIETAPTRRTPAGLVSLKYTADGDPVVAALYNRHFARAGSTEKQQARTREKLAKAGDLVVLMAVATDLVCGECAAAIVPGNFMTLEGERPLCLTCADFDHLEFLPAGDTALTRRARKHSPLAAVVLRFNRSRKHYERQGLLVTSEARSRAEDECLADAGERAARRLTASAVREVADRRLADAFTSAIRGIFPACPAETAATIARHASVRGSGRVGRSAAGQSLDPHAVRAAVVAHIRHAQTEYDSLLMLGIERRAARDRIHSTVQDVLDTWSRG